MQATIILSNDNLIALTVPAIALQSCCAASAPNTSFTPLFCRHCPYHSPRLVSFSHSWSILSAQRRIQPAVLLASSVRPGQLYPANPLCRTTSQHSLHLIAPYIRCLLCSPRLNTTSASQPSSPQRQVPPTPHQHSTLCRHDCRSISIAALTNAPFTNLPGYSQHPLTYLLRKLCPY